MLQIVRSFHGRFVRSGRRDRLKPPPPNFFSGNDTFSGTIGDGRDYASFLKRTVQLVKEAEVVARLSNEFVQRSPLNGEFFL
jgi:hypothetical protein